MKLDSSLNDMHAKVSTDASIESDQVKPSVFFADDELLPSDFIFSDEEHSSKESLFAVSMSASCAGEKAHHNLDSRESDADILRLLTSLLHMVVRELREQLKHGPINRQCCLELQTFADCFRSIAANTYPVGSTIIDQSGASISPKQPYHVSPGTHLVSSERLERHCAPQLLSPVAILPSTSLESVVSGSSGLSPVSPTKTVSCSGSTSPHRQASDESKYTKALVDVFHMLDVDGGGTVSRDELRAALHAVKVPAARAQKILNAADVDGDGEIDLAEWEAAVARGGDEEMRRVSKQLLAASFSGSWSEKDRQPSPCCMLRPDSPMRLIWDVALALLCIFVALVLPFTNGFDEWIDDDVFVFLLKFELVVDVVFVLDVCMNFQTGIMGKDGTLIMDRRRVAYEYCASWFALDLISSVPLDVISSGRLTNVRVLKLLKVPKLFRAVRVIKQLVMAQSELVTVVDENLSSPVLRALRRRSVMFVLTILVCHWLACLMAFVSHFWITDYLRGNGMEPTLWQSYLVAVYWAMTTMTTVGYGDLIPSSDWERLYTVIAMVIGGTYYGYVIGTISAIVSNRDLNASAYHDRMDEIYAWLDHHQFPSEMRRRIIRYFKGYLHEKAAVNEADVVNKLPPSLRKEVGKLVLHEDIRNNPIFDNLPINAVTRLHKIVQTVYIDKGHMVVQEGDVGTAMFIVGKGMVRMEHCDVDGDNVHARVLCSGDSFGEEILAGLEERYNYTVVALKNTANLYMIEKEAFEQLFEHMHCVKDQVINNATTLYAAWP